MSRRLLLFYVGFLPALLLVTGWARAQSCVLYRVPILSTPTYASSIDVCSRLNGTFGTVTRGFTTTDAQLFGTPDTGAPNRTGQCQYTVINTTPGSATEGQTVSGVVSGGWESMSASGSSCPAEPSCSSSSSSCPGGYSVTSQLNPAADNGSPSNGVGEPINPATGNVYTSELDIAERGQGSPIEFRRFYNKADATGVDGVIGWRHSYARSITTVYQTASSFYPGSSASVSPQYATLATACTSGFAAIQSSVSAWASAAATYNNGVCVLSNSTGTIGTLPIQSSPGMPGSSTPIEYDLIRDDGQTLRFTLQNGVINNQPGVSIRLAVTGSGFTVTDDNDNIEVYSSAGALQSITSRGGVVQTISYDSNGLFKEVVDSFGNSLIVTRNAQGSIGSIALSGGGTVQYGYDSDGRLSTVTNLDNTSRSYVYGTSGFPNAITGLVDESGGTYSIWVYDALQQAVSTQQAVDANAQSLTYNSNGSVTVTDALGAVRTFSYSRVGDINKVVGISGSQCPTCRESAATTYDSAGWVSSRTDYNGNLTCYQNDPIRGLELIRVEGIAPGGTCPAPLSGYTPAAGTLQRVITTQWSPSFREPAVITEPNRTTAFTFDGNGNILTKTITDTTVAPNVSRTWIYSYNGFGQVLTAQDPRGNTTAYAYYSCSSGSPCGQVQTITNALGQVTTFNAYNAYGQPLTLTDPNGVVTTLTYDARQRLTSRQVGSETTGYSYYATGLLHTVTLPDGSTISDTYDAAHRLTNITDSVGNSINYTLDALGNRTAENATDPLGTFHRIHTRVFNALSELAEDINAAGSSAVTTTLGYDGNGNLTTSDAPLSRNTANQYDALNRLVQITDPAGGVTQLSYDANDDLAAVSDPRSLATTYSHDGFGDVTQQVSPDSGTTIHTYDSSGNLNSTTDARGAVASHSYDALNRVTQAAYSDQTINFTYDAGTNGIGRLTGASDANHTLSWAYDALGRVTGKAQVVASVTQAVGYAYVNGDLTTLITPSGQTIAYGYSNHRITSISVNGTALLSGVTYDPFGPATGWTWGNNTTVSRSFNQDGNPQQIVTAGVTDGYTVDSASRITAISDSGLSSNSWTFGFDALDRVTSGSSSALSRGYSYDADGNQLATTGTVAFTDSIASGSNQLNATTGAIVRTYSYDAAGNTTGDGTRAYTFNQRGRLSQATVGGNSTSYIYNALGQLIEKSGSAGATLLVYDESGHLLGEYTASGAVIQETVWMGDIPVATLQPSGTSMATYYVHTDHLGTPRKITRPSDNGLMWRFDPDTFGSLAPNGNPSGLGAFGYDLRFPGQIYMAETGLNYNYYRDLDTSTGRYLESDPIGLHGGSNSTYSYGNENPISRIDPFGLCAADTHPATPGEIAQILSQADSTQKKGLSHAQIQCNQFVNQSINAAFPGAVPNLNTTGLLNGQGPFEPVTTPSVGNLVLFSKPGHVAFVTGVSNGAVTQFLGSQSSSGPAYVSLPNPYYWTPLFNSPNNVSYLQICLPN
jgi:RHS repeat-associated protein